MIKVAIPITGKEEYSAIKKVVFSGKFVSGKIVENFEKTYAFYTQVLGFQSYLSHRGTSSGLGQNVFGLPRDIALKVQRQVEILHPQGLNEGSIELIHFEELQGFPNLMVQQRVCILHFL